MEEIRVPAALLDSLKTRLQRAEALERIMRILRDTQSLEEVLLVFVIAVSHELSVDSATYILRDEVLVRRSLRMRSQNDPPPPESLAFGSLTQFFDSDEPTAEEALPEAASTALFGSQSGVLVPLRVEGTLWGALTITIDRGDVVWLSSETMSFWRTLGSHLELALASAHAFEREINRAQERATLAEAARTILSYTTLHPLADVMCRLAATLVRADKACAVRLDRERLKILGSFGDGIDEMTERLAANRKGAGDRDAVMHERRWIRVEEGPGYAIVPLVRRPAEPGERETVDAYLIVGQTAKERFGRDALRLLLELGALFASALRNLELYETTARANTALRESSEFKDDLIAMLAHDFKGPLTVMLGYCELLLETDGVHREEIETIFSQTQRLVRLSEDALTLARTQADGFSLARTTVDFGEFLSESAESIARASGRVLITIKDEALRVSLDPDRFRHVIDNLLENALKYSEKEVNVVVRREGDRTVLEVTDRGIGIPEDELATIFARFGRATNARNQGVSGSGVGLYMAKKIVEVHRGEITVYSKEDEGTTFTVSLPLLVEDSD